MGGVSLRRGILVGGLFFLFLSLLGAQRALSDDPPSIAQPVVMDLNGNPVTIGDEVAQLELVDGVCEGDAGVEVKSGDVADADVVLKIDENCRVTVFEIIPHPAEEIVAVPSPEATCHEVDCTLPIPDPEGSPPSEGGTP